MIKPLKPRNEVQRQKTLDSYDILDTHAETAYDDLTKIASQICKTPIAVISLIDNERQWFKSRLGLEVPETPRNISFCGHAILGQDIMEVPDAQLDERFKDNPLVVGAPHIRFYAGAPLVLPTGEILGTICVIDRNPRKLEEDQRAALRMLARNVVIQLQLRNHLSSMAEREDSLNRMIQEAISDAANRSKAFARLSHEVRTPLNGVLGMLEILARTQLDPDQIKYVSVAQEATDVMIKMVNETLDISKAGTGSLNIQKLPVDLSKNVQKTVQLLSWVAAAKGLALTYQEKGADFHVQGDPTRLSQILTNLLGNALKFTEKGAVSVTLNTAPSGDGKLKVEIAVTDTGAGLPPEVLKNLFHPSTQAGTERGIGLSISKSLAEAMGGSLSCESKDGLGSTFKLSLTADRAADDVDLSKIKILVAEDEAINQLVLTAMCNQIGCVFTLAKNGEEAVASARDCDYDVILMDRYMPVCDGLDAARQIRELEKTRGTHTPIIAISATNEIADRKLFTDAGMDDQLDKPFRVDEFIAKLKKWAA